LKVLSAKFNNRILAGFCGSAIALTICGTSVQAQEPESGKLLTGTTQQNPQPSPNSNVRKRPPKKNDKTGGRRNTPRVPVDTGNGSVAKGGKKRSSVTFYTGAPEIELLLDGKSIGTSGKDTRLVTVVDDGDHTLTAKKDGNDLKFSQLITISTKQTTVDVANSLNRVVTQMQPSDQPKTVEVTAKVENKTVSSETIIEAYKDPMRTTSVSAKDWEAIYKQNMELMLAGNTKNDIEGMASFAKGQTMLAAGNYKEAVSAFSAATVFLPDWALMYYGLGLAKQTAGFPAEAVVEYQKAIRLEDKFALPYRQMGGILLAQGKNKEAATYFQKARLMGDDTPEVKLGIASSQLKNKNCTAAMKELQALETESPSSGVFMALGECYLQQKKSLSAIEYFKKAVDLEPNAPQAHFKLGETYFEEKEYDKAKESLERALSLDTDNKYINRKEVEGLIEKARKKIK
jgi:tetratricopeptide (TPR) repeat protein